MLNGEIGKGVRAGKTPELPRTPETAKESEPQREAPRPSAEFRSPEPTQVPALTPVAASAPAPVPAPIVKDETRMKVERVLEENLWDLYFAMPKEARVKFRAEGEVAAEQVRVMINEKKARPHAFHAVIVRWLRSIPRVSQWFLLQEGKIKTDNVMTIVKERRAANGDPE